MKKLMTLIALAAISIGAFAQNVDLRRKIEVSGTAEKEVTPDIINVNISLQEYMNGKTKVTIEQLEKQLEGAVKEANIPKEDFTISNVSAWNNVYNKKKTPDFLASKQYRIKFHDLNKYNFILSQIDPKGIQSTDIASYDYSKMFELKKELKIQALKFAKEKAAYLLASIDEKLGGAIDITEIDNSNYNPPRPVMYARAMTMDKAAPAGDSDISTSTIKLSFQVNATFEIVK